MPNRDSKLTHFLKESFLGTCHILIIAAVSSSKLSYTDTHNTLNEDNLKAYECLDHFLQSQAAKRLAIKETLEDLHNKRRQNFERSQDLLDEACAAGGLEAVQADITNLGLVVERTEMQGPRQIIAELAERLCRKCVHWEDLNSVSYQPAQPLRYPGGQELLLLGPNGCPRSPCQKGQGCPDVTWANEKNEMSDGQLDLASLLHAPDWRLATTLQLPQPWCAREFMLVELLLIGVENEDNRRMVEVLGQQARLRWMTQRSLSVTDQARV
ncbi:hypothetical protein MRX96_007632 [Rhipicephalus microplus]